MSITMALPVAGRTGRIRQRHWDDLAEAIGLPINAARSANKLALQVAESINLDDLPVAGSPLNAAQRELRHRRYEIS